MQVRGVKGLTLTNNVFDMGPWQTVGGLDVLNGAVFLENANGGNSDVTLNANYLNGGGYTLRIYQGTNFKFINNRFGPDGHYGQINNVTSPGNITEASGNVLDVNGTSLTI